MIAETYLQALNRMSHVLPPVLLMTLIKSILLFTIVTLLIRVFNVTSARTKYVLWVCYVFFVLLIAIYTVISPIFHLNFFQISIRQVEESKLLSSLLLPQHQTVTVTINYTVDSTTYLQERLHQPSVFLSWSLWALCTWIIGMVLCSLYALVGRIGVSYIFKNSSEYNISHLIENISCIMEDLGIKRKVKIIVSNRCRLPFTYKFINPVLVIPNEARNWSASKLHAILVHELAHIRRHDYLILSLSRSICFVFWFIPVTWIAHAYLQLEQEKLCDLAAVHRGERPTQYARYMIDLVRTARSLVLLDAIFIVRKKNKMLEERVTNVLNIKKSTPRKGGTTMKMRNFPVILILCLSVMIIAGGLTSTEKAISDEGFPNTYIGTWVNPDYQIIDDPTAKIVIRSDGTLEQFGRVDIAQGIKGTYTIVDHWGDPVGNKYYKVKKEIPGIAGGYMKSLWKLNANGKELECVFENTFYPPKIDPTHIRYRIYYRK